MIQAYLDKITHIFKLIFITIQHFLQLQNNVKAKI